MLIVVIMGRWSEFSACIVYQVVRLYSVVEIDVMPGEVACCSVVCGSCPLWSSVYEYQSVECASTSPESIESCMLVTCRMQYAMSVSTVL